MAKITIIKGEEFKIAVKEKITQDDLFIEHDFTSFWQIK